MKHHSLLRPCQDQFKRPWE